MITKLLLIFVLPDTFNNGSNVVLFDNAVKPKTFNDDNNVVFCFNDA